MNLSAEEFASAKTGNPVEVTVQNTQFVILRKDMFDRVRQVVQCDDESPDPDVTYEMIESVMADDDANDPALDSYQIYKA